MWSRVSSNYGASRAAFLHEVSGLNPHSPRSRLSTSPLGRVGREERGFLYKLLEFKVQRFLTNELELEAQATLSHSC